MLVCVEQQKGKTNRRMITTQGREKLRAEQKWGKTSSDKSSSSILCNFLSPVCNPPPNMPIKMSSQLKLKSFIRIRARRNSKPTENPKGKLPGFGVVPEQTTEGDQGEHSKVKRYSLHITGLAEARLEAWLNVVPGALVLVFFLGPDNLGVRVFGAFSFHQVVWER
jgi:hypothetical protein